MSDRGKIKYLDRYKQLISYEGLERHRKITPTDIDGFIDYNGNAFFYIEGKEESRYKRGGLDTGQKRAIQNLIKSNTMAGHAAAAVIFTHTCSVNEIINAKDMKIVEAYFDRKWHKLNGSCTLSDAIDRFEKYCENKGIYI